MAAPKLKLYVDVVSPFAYLAFHVVRTSPVFKTCEVTYVPALLGGIMKACNNTAPINIKNKNTWIRQERFRWARYFNIPIADKVPANWPMQTVAVQRALTALALTAPEKVGDTIAALYDTLFVQCEQVAKAEDFLPVFEAVVGKQVAAEVMAKSTTDEVKHLLIANTSKAVDEDGAFGLPWFVATNSEGKTECYWGFDHLGMVADHLGLKKLQPESDAERGWKAML